MNNKTAKCPDCGRPLSFDDDISTLVGFISPAGHNHDDNCRSRRYFCACGYAKTIYKRNRCPVCDWVGIKTCFCHKGTKVDEWLEDAVDTQQQVMS
jgi:hypothetical protein